MSRHRETMRLLEATEILTAHAESTFGERFLRATKHLFAGSLTALDTFSSSGTHAVVHDVPFDARVGAIMREHGAEIITRDHPFAAEMFAGAKHIVRLSELASEREFRKTELHSVVYRSVDVRFQLIAPLPALDGHGVLTLSRDGLDFTDRDKAIVARYVRTVSRALATEKLLDPFRAAAVSLEASEREMQALLARAGVSKREASALFWMAQGKRNAEIAIILGISTRTVEAHLAHAYRKLGVESRAAAIREINERRGAPIPTRH